MQTHKQIFYWIFGCTIASLIGYCCFTDGSMICEICLALFGSGAIASFLELVNYFTSKRQLILQVIADNTMMSNYIFDSIWLYRTTTDLNKKLDIFVELYKKSQSNIFTLSKDIYAPFRNKEKLTNVLEDNSNAMIEIWNLLFEGQRQIELMRASMELLVFKNEKERKKGLHMLNVKIVEMTDCFIEPLAEQDRILLKCNKKYKEAYKLTNTATVEDHFDIMSKVETRIKNVLGNSKK